MGCSLLTVTAPPRRWLARRLHQGRRGAGAAAEGGGGGGMARAQLVLLCTQLPHGSPRRGGRSPSPLEAHKKRRRVVVVVGGGEGARSAA